MSAETDEAKDLPGVLPLKQAFCEHGHPNGCSMPERFLTVWPLAAYGDLSQQDWGKVREKDSRIGHFYTLAPEISTNDTYYDNRVDTWAFGVVCALVLLSKKPGRSWLCRADWQDLLSDLDSYTYQRSPRAVLLVALLYSKPSSVGS